MKLHLAHYFAKLLFKQSLPLLSIVLLLLMGCTVSGNEENIPTLTPPPLSATTDKGDADVLFVSAQMTDANGWSFSVTVEHNDSGWEDYADGWDVVLPDGTVLLPNLDDPFTRLLLHPHENEQPFTRSQSNIEIPAEITQVTVRAHDLVDGFGGQEVVVDLTAVSGKNFEVDR